MSISQHLLLEFSSISYGLDTLLGDYFPNTFATVLMFPRGCFICLGVLECRILYNYIYICVILKSLVRVFEDRYVFVVTSECT